MLSPLTGTGSATTGARGGVITGSVGATAGDAVATPIAASPITPAHTSAPVTPRTDARAEQARRIGCLAEHITLIKRIPATAVKPLMGYPEGGRVGAAPVRARTDRGLGSRASRSARHRRSRVC